MEFLNLVLILIAALFVLRKPEKERSAFRLLVVSTVLMVLLFTLATRSGLLPGLNY
ncbi:MAG: dihydroneopterin aldolase [Gemmatimonadaceae bacterium]|nr:dihydroneopterin aldolase [Gemmatimonadaceae bacterium]